MLVAAAVAIFSAAIVIAIQPLYFAKKTRSRRELPQDASWGRELASALSSPTAVIDGYVVRFVNTSFLQAFGMVGMSDQIIGMPFTNLIHPADHQTLAELTAEAIIGKTKNDPTKMRLVRADGSTLPANTSLTPMRQDGENYLMLFQFTPVSATQPLSNNYEEQFNYHSIIDRLEEIVFQLNAEGKIIFLNPSWEHRLEYKVQDSLSKSLLDFIHPEDKPMVEARLDSLAQGKRKNCAFEARLLSLRGDPNWITLRAKSSATSIEERAGVIGTMTDISNQKEAEAGLLANRRAEYSQLNNIPGMIYRCRNDRSWTFEFASDGCIDVTGYAPLELINDPILNFNLIIHPDDRAAVWEYVKHQLNTGEKFQLIYRINTRSGETKLVQEHGRGIFSSTGELLALEGFIMEIPSQRYNVNSTVSLHHS
jgi:PAS domain S-box-containing protein